MAGSQLEGESLGHYELLERIGEGGMGVVFRARDQRLQRVVAVKLLPAGTLADDASRRRFRTEALALSALNHPNISTVHDFDTQAGIDFLVTEYIAGNSLDELIPPGGLAEKEVVRLALQLLEGLAAAHGKGVVHRDLKPANLRVTSDGRLKILDFGLARFQPGAESITQSVTDGNVVAGTVPYMSPEQLRGENTDARSDLWAVGVVLYEMATGRLPFAAKTASAVAGEVLHTDPPPPRQVRNELSPAFEFITLKCLEKAPEHRYQSADQLRVDLQRLHRPSSGHVVVERKSRKNLLIAAVAVAAILVVAAVLYFYVRRAAIHSLAVLPFTNATGDQSSDFISDGISEELINSLTEVPGLRIIARPTAFTYKGRQVSPQQVGKDLGVGALVLGRVSQLKDNIAVQVDLIDTADGSEIWGGQFQRPKAELQAIHNDIVLQVRNKLRLSSSGEQPDGMRKGQTQSSEAYQWYLRGRDCISQVSPARFEDCGKLFQQAIAADPNYAKAWAGLADAYAYSGLFEVSSPMQMAVKARQAASRALEIDETVGEAHTSLGIIKLCFEWDFAGALAELKRAMELNPGDVFGRHWYAHYLEVTGDLTRAHAEMRKVADLDPISEMYIGDLANEYYLMHQPQKVVEMSRHWSNSTTEPLTWMVLALAYEQLGQNGQSTKAAERALATDDYAFTRGYMALLLARVGNRERARQLLYELKRRAQTEYIPPVALAMASFGSGDETSAYEYLRQAYEQRSPSIVLIMLMDPQFDRYRSDPRFIALAHRYGVPTKSGGSP